MKEYFPSWRKLKKNLPFAVSAVAYNVLLSRFHLPYMISWLAAVTIAFLVASAVPNLYQMTKQKKPGIRIWALLTAFAAVPTNAEYFMDRTFTSEKIMSLFDSHVPGGIGTARLLAWLMALVAIYFWYVVMCFLCDWLYTTVMDIFRQCSRSEVTTFLVLTVLLDILVIGVFAATKAFYKGSIIYTADSGALVTPNAYLVISHVENDLRQPLFAIFASPFIGAVYFLTMLIPIEGLAATFMALVQVPVMLMAYLLIARMLTKHSGYRNLFMIMMCSTYPVLLFSVMLEQYIISLFWLVLFLYFAVNEKKDREFVVVGAAGTLLTSASIGLFLDRKPKEMFRRLIRTGFLGLFLLTLFGRLDVLLNVKKGLELGRFAGKSVSWGDKMLQYLAFAKSCFAAPEAGITQWEYTLWSLKEVTAVNYVGIAVLLLAAAGFWLNRREHLVQISAYWVFFSWVVIFVIGWGTPENGAILYSLYFGWAFAVLLYKLLEWILKKINLEKALFLLGAVFVVCMLVVNVPAFLEMLEFAIEYSPL